MASKGAAAADAKDEPRSRWLALLLVTLAVGGSLFLYSRTGSPRTAVLPPPPEPPQATGVPPIHDQAPAASDASASSAPSWPTNVPYVSRTPAPATPAPPLPVAVPASNAVHTAEEVVAMALPAVVLVETPGGKGTGFFVSSDTALTNAHVVEGAAYVTLVSAGGERTSARVATYAPDQDLAVLRVSGGRANASSLTLGTLADVRVGEEVLAIGAPLGLQNTVTRGIVSAVRRSGSMTLIQTDAAINPGNSGGPLIDQSGRVVAINTMKVSGAAESLGFAIAADHARALIDGGSGAAPANARLGDLAPRPAEAEGSDDLRDGGEAAFEQVVADAARRADALDEYWTRITHSCLAAKVPSGSGDRDWFAVYEPSFPRDSVNPACGDMFHDFLQATDMLRTRMTEADDAARRAGVYPGTRREIRGRHRLAWDGWER
jgi:putative serine protease PepD